ncbi:MAG: peptidylprolyl isomerase [Ignavibacteria bacterium]|nr:peptidylprolyl isomerase [Ignavibacteria bacterium]
MSKTALVRGALFLALCLQSMVAQPLVIDRIAAIVGKEPILLSDVNAQTEYYAFANHTDPNTPGLKQQVLDAMINEKLMLAKALEDTTIMVSEDMVTNQLDALIQQRIQQAGSEKKLEEVYSMPISRMKREFRDETRKQLLVQQLQQTKFGDLQASRREVEEFFTQYKDSLPNVPEELELYHMYKIPKIGEVTKNVLKAKLLQIADSIKAGGDFAAFAKRYSEDGGTASAGGDLGFVRRGEFFKEFEEAVFSLQDNQLSSVIETPLGLHIIQLLERRGEQVHPRHILLKFKNDTTQVEFTIAFLKGLKDSVAHGVSFSDLAKRYSDDKESGPLGGYLGRLPVSQFDQSLLETVKGLKEGEISDPVPVTSGQSSGYQIIFLKKRVPEHLMNLTDDWKRVEQHATSYKRSIEYQKWLKQLRSEIYWDIRL